MLIKKTADKNIFYESFANVPLVNVIYERSKHAVFLIDLMFFLCKIIHFECSVNILKQVVPTNQCTTKICQEKIFNSNK